MDCFSCLLGYDLDFSLTVGSLPFISLGCEFLLCHVSGFLYVEDLCALYGDFSLE